MRLLIIRHAKAERDSPTGLDRDRPLREKGERQAAFLASALRDIDIPPERIVSSPFVRTRETARAIAAAGDLDLVFDERLEVGEPAGAVLDLIAEHDNAGALALIGHNPQLETLLSALLRGPASGSIRVRTGEAFILDLDGIEPGGGELVTTLRM